MMDNGQNLEKQNHTRGSYFERFAMLWGLFFLICFGLGYATLNRYDPRTIGNIDSIHYYKLVAGSPEDVDSFARYRVLIPYLAKPLYWLVRGRVETWDPVFFSLLVVNSAFCAMSACFIVSLGRKMLGDYTVALLGASLYLLNFAVANAQLAGLVDAGEACLLLAVVWAMFNKRWWLLPIFGVLGALTKETFVPLSCAFAIVWWVSTLPRSSGRPWQVVWVAAMGMAGFSTIVVIQSVISRELVFPWDLAVTLRSQASYFPGLVNWVLNRSFWYIFVWLLPLGIWRLKYLPKTWVFASVAATSVALILGTWNNAGGNVARALFNIVGPPLSISVALLLTKAEPVKQHKPISTNARVSKSSHKQKEDGNAIICNEEVKLSIVIPVYNEESTISEVIDRVRGVELPGIEKEIIVTDDGSRDNTASIVASKCEQYADTVKVHTSLINLGKGAAVRFGIEFATGDIILIQDADLELNPEEYPALIAPLLRGDADVVYGSRFRGRANNIPLRSRLSNRFLTMLTNWLYGARLTDMATAYKVFPREVIKSLELRSARFEFEPEVTAKLLLAGYTIAEVPITYNPRSVQDGKKIGWIDGIEYIYTLFKYRFFR